MLIWATTRDPSEISPALRSRCSEVFLNTLTPQDIVEIVRAAAERLGVKPAPGVAELAAEYTIEGRRATRRLADALGVALYRGGGGRCEAVITKEDMLEVIQSARLSSYVSTMASAR